MNMRRREKSWFSWRQASLMMAVVVLVSMAETVTSQPSNRNNIMLRYYCSLYYGRSPEYFLSNLNTTLSSLHRQILNGSRYAVARTLLNGESVWGLASCRAYVSKANCIACYNYAVAQLKVCGTANGASVIYNDCDVRYENNNFYADANIRAGVVTCGNTTSHQASYFRKTVEGLMSDLRTATPKTSNYYAASSRRVPDGNSSVYAIAQCNLNLTQSVCQDCLNSRYSSIESCLPGTTGRAIHIGCYMRYSRTPFFGLNQTIDITPYLSDGDSNKRYIVGGVVGGVCFLLLVHALIIWRIFLLKSTTSRLQDKSTGSTDLLQGPAKYSYDDIKIATNNFSDEQKLGGGVFGEVYKGTLKDGNTVAVKKTVMGSTRGKIHFDGLKILCNVHHRHLVRLLGYCNKGSLLYLVNEYTDNGSLDQFLYGDKSMNLNWRQRFEIIYGTSRGLACLHEQYHVTIIHRNIKTSNILLDNEFQLKIADFGLIRLLPEDKTHFSTKLAGSMDSGYVAPEYAIHGQLSEKVDTYSFGIVVLEIVSGKRCHNVKGHDESVGRSLLDHAWNLYDNGTHSNLVDERLDPSEYAIEDLKKIIEIALMCTQSPVSSRPAMSEVVILLSDKSLDEMPPVRSTFHEDDISIKVNTLASLPSNATASTIQFSGR